MNRITSDEILKMVNEIDEKKFPAIEQYLEAFFTEYLEINYLDDLKFTGEEHMKIENAITHLMKVSTLISVQTTLEVLEKTGTIHIEKDDN